ncbi:ATP-binding protein [Streptomyces albofaciens JCM 4342]|uniref:AAA family ATPase n=1 Tax=Streptomyces albofaciens TaxID=66866 RepID=UPI001239ECBA|nr:AAA family ATPase [Streptomyces albofaciens]KAA6212666.1 ATP-binding protein [Streptomyces albofaciens JCM 4342]
METSVLVPAGPVLLVGAPAAGKSAFAGALVAQGRLPAAAVVSSDAIAEELFGPGADRGTVGAQVFEERDRRVAERLHEGRTAVIDATNVLPRGRERLPAIARKSGAPVTALRFALHEPVLLLQSRERATRIPDARIHVYAALLRDTADARRLLTEGVSAVHEVPGRAQGVRAAEAARRFRFEGCEWREEGRRPAGTANDADTPP